MWTLGKQFDPCKNRNTDVKTMMITTMKMMMMLMTMTMLVMIMMLMTMLVMMRQVGIGAAEKHCVAVPYETILIG